MSPEVREVVFYVVYLLHFIGRAATGCLRQPEDLMLRGLYADATDTHIKNKEQHLPHRAYRNLPFRLTKKHKHLFIGKPDDRSFLWPTLESLASIDGVPDSPDSFFKHQLRLIGCHTEGRKVVLEFSTFKISVRTQILNFGAGFYLCSFCFSR
jgi:hypothetical protein